MPDNGHGREEAPQGASGPAVVRIARVFWANGAVRYLLVGGLCFLADVAMLWGLHSGIGLPLIIATPVAFLLSFGITYTAQRMLAFRSDAKVTPSVARYTALVIANTVATTAIVWGAEQLGLGWLAGKVCAVVATTVWNYFAYRHWVFAGKSHGESNV